MLAKKIVSLKKTSSLVKLIEFYQRIISPRKAPCCRYSPTCSTYAKDAIIKYGSFRGSAMALLRILRCNPLFEGGYDPVD
ncbi:MAG: membrane protein insertion efficiency factor YidD [Oscillospiraceae bacterium]|nr:membrane protein insertion efficiency factor YidD [Oscillospiraceae bacterium]